MSREPSARILIADDHEDNVELLRARLEASGYRVSVAMDGQQAVDSVLASPPDLVLLDIMMPKMDGMEVARRIKSTPGLPFIPIILQTALDTTEAKVQGLGAGADDFITKPINFAELEARVNSLLRIKALQEDLEQRERELSQLNDQLMRIARTDALTQLDNRRYLEERLQESFEYARRVGEPLALVMCDLDQFKSVNDTYGHPVGDAVLRQLAQILRAQARGIDRIGRYGGEEFMLLLPGTTAEEAAGMAERVRNAVQSHTFSMDGVTLQRTLSCGVAAWPHPQLRDAAELVRAADDALYVAKETGRNRVVTFGSREFLEHTQPIDAAADDARPADLPAGGDGGPRRPPGEDRGAPAGA